MEANVPQLENMLLKLLEIDEHLLDTQEMDYIEDIRIYTTYLTQVYEGEKDKRPKLLMVCD